MKNHASPAGERKGLKKVTSDLRAISGDLRPYRNLVRILFISLLFSLLTLAISVYFGLSVYGESIKGKTEIIQEYEEQLKEQGKVVIPEKRLNEFKDYYEFFLDLDEIEDADTRKTLKNVRKSIETWHKGREKQREK